MKAVVVVVGLVVRPADFSTSPYLATSLRNSTESFFHANHTSYISREKEDRKEKKIKET